jgi:hypothetical protein
LPAFVGPGFPPGGTGITVTGGIGGGNGLISGGQRPKVIVPRIGRVTVIHKGLGAGTGKIVLIGGGPVLTVSFDIRMSFVVTTGGVMVAD